jgi:CSLREA domain-containing protein
LSTLAIGPVAAVDYYVTTTLDSADGSCDSHCSLREAVIAANDDAAEDTIYLMDR